MKIVIPAECQIAAHTYRIRINNKALDVGELRAKVNYNQQIIRLSTHLDGQSRSSSMIFEALLHEMLHPINHLFMGGALSEEQIEQVSAGLAQMLLSMGIEPDFSQVPEE